MFTQIVDKLTVDLDLSVFHDGYKERIESLISESLRVAPAFLKIAFDVVWL